MDHLRLCTERLTSPNYCCVGRGIDTNVERLWAFVSQPGSSSIGPSSPHKIFEKVERGPLLMIGQPWFLVSKRPRTSSRGAAPSEPPFGGRLCLSQLRLTPTCNAHILRTSAFFITLFHLVHHTGCSIWRWCPCASKRSKAYRSRLRTSTTL